MNTTLPNSFTLNIYNTDPDVSRDVSLFELGVASGIPSDVVITELGSANYSQILNSQTGGIYALEGLTIQINQAPDDASKQRQILKPLRFKKIDVNGDEVLFQKVQVVDPYQYQYSYDYVSLTDDGESFILDGNTAFRYTLEPLTGVNVTFNYVQVKNESFETIEGDLDKLKDINNIEQIEANTEYATAKVLSIDNASVIAKKKSKSNWLWWLIGGTAVFLFINPFKSNQK